MKSVCNGCCGDDLTFDLQGSALAPVEGAEEFHRLRQSLTMLNFSEEIQMRFVAMAALV